MLAQKLTPRHNASGRQLLRECASIRNRPNPNTRIAKQGTTFDKLGNAQASNVRIRSRGRAPHIHCKLDSSGGMDYRAAYNVRASDMHHKRDEASASKHDTAACGTQTNTRSTLLTRSQTTATAARAAPHAAATRQQQQARPGR